MSSGSPSPISKSGTPPAASNRPITVLVVDDLEPTRRDMKRLLELAGFAVLTAATIEEGLRTLDEWAVDAVVADLWLSRKGGADGGTMLDSVRRWHPGVTRILFTADPIGASIARESGHLFFDKDEAIAELVLILRMWVPRA